MKKNKNDFDKFAGNYENILKQNIKISGFDPSYFDEIKINEIKKQFLSALPNNRQLNFLNYGCGVGKSEKYISKYFPNSKIKSIDISLESLKTAKKNNEKFNNLHFINSDGINLCFKNKFDIIFAANVFHHIDKEKHSRILSNLSSLLVEKGHLFIFEHNPINPLTRLAFNTCEFDKGCNMIYPRQLKKILKQNNFKKIIKNYIIFFPKMFSALIPLENYLKKIPFGAQYFLTAIK